jgi:catalase
VIGFAESARPLLEAVGVHENGDAGLTQLGANGEVAAFVEACRQVRVWDRERLIDQT